MKSIYYLQHEWFDGEYDYPTNIAVYSSLEKAESALMKFKVHPYFASHSEGFTISEYEIDEDNWTEGFFTY